MANLQQMSTTFEINPRNNQFFSHNNQFENLEDEDFDGNWSLGTIEEETDDSENPNYESKIIKLFYQYKNVYSKEELLSFHHPTTCTAESLTTTPDVYSEEYLPPVNLDQKSLVFFEEVLFFPFI